MPFFLLFIMFLATLIRLGVADMALYKSAAETSELIVAYAYPVELTRTAVEELANEKFQSMLPEEIDFSEVKDWANQGLQFFGIDVGASIENFFESLTASTLEPILQDKFEQATGDRFFDPSRLSVTNVEIPSVVGGSGKYLQIDVSYEVDVSIPFVNKTIVLRKTSYERIWSGS